jgi:hypothetical protein
LCNFLYEKGQNIWLEKVKSIKNTSEIRRIKSDRANASMTGISAIRNYDMTVMDELLSKPQSQLCKLFSTGRFRQGTGAVFRYVGAKRY